MNHVSPEIQTIIEPILLELNVTIEELQSKSREAHLVRARRTVAKSLRKYGFTFKEIGDAMNRIHCSIIHLINTEGHLVARVSPKISRSIHNEAIRAQIKYHEAKIATLKNLIKL